MAIGTTAAIVGGLIAAGGQVAGATIASRGAKGAAKTQSTAANVAGRRAERATQDALRYIEARRTGQTAPPASPYPLGGADLSAISRLSPTAPGRPHGPVQGRPVNRAPLSFGQPQTVLLESPTGERRSMGIAEAQRYIQKGARVIR